MATKLNIPATMAIPMMTPTVLSTGTPSEMTKTFTTAITMMRTSSWWLSVTASTSSPMIFSTTVSGPVTVITSAIAITIILVIGGASPSTTGCGTVTTTVTTVTRVITGDTTAITTSTATTPAAPELLSTRTVGELLATEVATRADLATCSRTEPTGTKTYGSNPAIHGFAPATPEPFLHAGSSAPAAVIVTAATTAKPPLETVPTDQTHPHTD